MSGHCPHGYAQPPSAAYPGHRGTTPQDNNARIRVIRDSRECPECLQECIRAANNLLNRVFLRRIFDAETFKMWTDYVRRYNP